VRNGKGLESGDVIAGVERLLGDSAELTLQRRGDFLQLALDVGGVELGEDRADGALSTSQCRLMRVDSSLRGPLRGSRPLRSTESSVHLFLDSLLARWAMVLTY
jgi:hypothetical protein